MSEVLNMQKQKKEKHSKVFELKYKVLLKYLKWLADCKQCFRISGLESFLKIDFSVDVNKLKTQELERELKYLRKKLEEINVVIEKYKNFNEYLASLREIFHDVFLRVRFETNCTRKEFEKLVEHGIEDGFLTLYEDGAIISGPIVEELKKETLNKLEAQKKKIEESIRAIEQKIRNEQT
jgi:hypothetical protein